jgi:hypothetical protein
MKDLKAEERAEIIKLGKEKLDQSEIAEKTGIPQSRVRQTLTWEKHREKEAIAEPFSFEEKACAPAEPPEAQVREKAAETERDNCGNCNAVVLKGMQYCANCGARLLW